MNAFLCAFAAIVAVANGYAVQAGYGGPHHSGPVVGGKAYQVLPAVSVHSIAPSSGYSSAGGYGGSYGGGYGAAPSYDIQALIAAAGGHISPELAAKLALHLPHAGAPLIDLSGASYAHGNAPAHYGKLAYAVHADKTYSHHVPEYKAESHSAPAYKAPEYKAPVAYKAEHKAPAATYSAPEYKAPAHKAPTYEAPSYKAPASHSAPAYKAPVYEAPSHKASSSHSGPAKAAYPSAAAATSYVAEKSYSAKAAY